MRHGSRVLPQHFASSTRRSPFWYALDMSKIIGLIAFTAMVSFGQVPAATWAAPVRHPRECRIWHLERLRGETRRLSAQRRDHAATDPDLYPWRRLGARDQGIRRDVVPAMA